MQKVEGSNPFSRLRQIRLYRASLHVVPALGELDKADFVTRKGLVVPSPQKTQDPLGVRCGGVTAECACERGVQLLCDRGLDALLEQPLRVDVFRRAGGDHEGRRVVERGHCRRRPRVVHVDPAAWTAPTACRAPPFASGARRRTRRRVGGHGAEQRLPRRSCPRSRRTTGLPPPSCWSMKRSSVKLAGESPCRASSTPTAPSSTELRLGPLPQRPRSLPHGLGNALAAGALLRETAHTFELGQGQ